MRFKKLLALGLAMCMAITLVGCVNYLTAASQIAAEAATIIQGDSPEAAEYLNEAAADLSHLNDLAQAIKAAKTSTEKQALVFQAQAIVSAATGKLNKTLLALHVKDPATIHRIQIAVGIVNAALAVLASNVGIKQTQSVLASNLPMSQGKTAEDFRHEWAAAK